MAYVRKIARKKGVVYRVEIFQPDGSKSSRSFRTREEALTWSRGQEDAKRSMKHSGIVRVRLTLEDYFRDWMTLYASQHHSPGWQLTDETMFRRYVKPVLGTRLLDDIHPLDIQRVLNEMLTAGRAKSYANRVRQLLHKMFEEAVMTHRYLAFNPVSSIRPFKETPKPTVYLTAEQAQTLLQWGDCQPLGLGLHLALQLGLREGEIVGLKWDAVDLERRQLTVQRKWEKKARNLDEFAKGKKIRYLGIFPDGLLARLRQQRERFPQAEFVVCREDGSMISPMQLIHLIRRGASETGLPPVTIHGLRHTFASLYMQNKGDLFDLQKLMGHESVNTTERYRHTDPEYLKSRCQVFDLYADSAQTPPAPQKAALRLVSEGS